MASNNNKSFEKCKSKKIKKEKKLNKALKKKKVSTKPKKKTATVSQVKHKKGVTTMQNAVKKRLNYTPQALDRAL